ncbi:SpoIIE family protein phosphatase [Streptomyces canus]|uniref:ATP-binding SpoIIE family protein phosphatase n=1 Tax=Streptomyces canus TaxID=58343 RepID=UPI0038655FC5|nr:SpoIIE family protein phosphatase [Streptomyces canus]
MNDKADSAFGTDAARPVQNGHCVMGLLMASGEITAWESGHGEPLGMHPQEMVGRSLWQLFPEAVPEELSRCWLERMAWRGEVTLRPQGGSSVRVFLHIRPAWGREGEAPWLATVTPLVSHERDPASDSDIALLKQWALEQLPLPMALFDRDGIRVTASADMAGVVGGLTSDLLESVLDGIEPAQRRLDLERIRAAARQVLRTGETATCETSGQGSAAAAAHAWLISLYAVRDPGGQIEGVALAAVDSTEQHRARKRLSVLTKASRQIGTTLDLTRTAEELTQIATEDFADLAIVDLLDRVLGGDEARNVGSDELLLFRRVAQCSVLPGCPECVVSVGTTHTYAKQSPYGQALTAGRPLLVQTGAASLEQWRAGRADRAESIRQYGIHSILVVPVHARGQILGVSALCRHRTPEPFNEEDLQLAEELVSRAAICVDNARRYTRERSISLALQRSLLPGHTPSRAAAAVDVASRYLPADPEAGVGGDWFDVIPLPGARVGLVVGDVVGHGIQASATMGRLCTAVRTLADADLAPDELLTQLDDLVLRLDREATEGRGDTEIEKGDTSGSDLAEVGSTCLYAVYDPISRRCSIARAGHPVPVLVKPDGSAEFLDVPAGPPLGVGGLPFEVAEFELPAASVLALYTDGLLEDTEDDSAPPPEVFRDALAFQQPLESACETLLDRLLTRRRTDDAALLLAHTKTLGSGRVADWQPGTEPTTVAQARKWVSEILTSWSLPDLVYVAKLVVSELVTNAVRYGRHPVHLRLIHDSEVICEVSDASSAAPHLRRARTFDEGGRGLFIVAQLTQRWGSRQTQSGKTIWAEIPTTTSDSWN